MEFTNDLVLLLYYLIVDTLLSLFESFLVTLKMKKFEYKEILLARHAMIWTLWET
jgi:hypothetical protein